MKHTLKKWAVTIPALLLATSALTIAGVGVSASSAVTPPIVIGTPIYDGTTTPLPSNLVSESFEATSTSEFGNQVTFAGSNRLLNDVTVTMSSWACQSGTWNDDNCQTTAGATFTHPITLNIYGVGVGNSVGGLIATDTQTFTIPYRPSVDTTNCTGANVGKWYDGTTCNNGLAANITFSFPTTVDLPNNIVYGIAFNTSDFGAAPERTSASPPSCDTNPTANFSAGCPEDSLNVGLTQANAPNVGTDPIPGTAYLNSAFGGSYCDNGTNGTGTLRLDTAGTPCWTPNASGVGPPYYIPAVEFFASPASGTPAYNSLTTPLPLSLPSEGFEATQTSEFGNQVALVSGAGSLLNNVNVTLDSWGCETGTGVTCASTPGDTFSWPITLNLYNVGAGGQAVGSLIKSVTQTFAIPYRPSASANCTGSQAGEWFDAAADLCHGGVTAPITFTIPAGVTLPSPFIYGIAYNTSDYGAVPQRPLAPACETAVSGCPFDSLNVGLTTATAPSLGTDPFPGTVYQNSSTPGVYCDDGTAGTFRLDSATSACWTPNASNVGPPYYIPAVEFLTSSLAAAPTIGTATAGNGSASVTFTPPTVTGGSPITSYLVTAADSTTPGHGGQTASGSGSPITVSGLTPGDSYTFTVAAVTADGPGASSAPSNAVIPLGVPGAPTIGVATAGNAAASVTFTAPASNGGSAITSYTVTAADATTPANGGETATGATSPINVIGLTVGDSYTFTVTATNVVGTGPASAASNAVTPVAGVPAAPTIGTATAENAAAGVTFTAPASNGGSAITSYTVTAADAATPADGGQTAPGTASPIQVTGLTNGQSYTFTVTATNTIGTGPPSAPSNAVVPATGLPTVTVPGAPNISAPNARNKSATVNFSAPASNGGGAITSYTVTAADSTTPGNGGQTASGSGSPITVSGLTNGDSYTFTVTATNSAGTGPASAPSSAIVPEPMGYWLVASDGGIFTFGDANFFGSTGGIHLVSPVVGMATTPDKGGYWLVASDGGVFTFGDAKFHGSGSGRVTSPIVGMAVTSDGGGYWLAGSNGEVYPYGDARDYGQDVPQLVTSPIVDITATSDGGGYWLVGSDGHIYTEGDAANLGSTFGQKLNAPIVGMAASPDGKGYWLLGGDGGIFTFGNVQFYGSTGAIHLNKPVVGIATSPDGKGYWLVASDGGIFSFGDAQFHGSTGALVLNQPVNGMASD